MSNTSLPDTADNPFKDTADKDLLSLYWVSDMLSLEDIDFLIAEIDRRGLSTG